MTKTNPDFGFAPQDYALATIVRRYGFYAALRYARNLGIAFEDTYFMCFGREPRKGGERV